MGLLHKHGLNAKQKEEAKAGAFNVPLEHCSGDFQYLNWSPVLELCSEGRTWIKEMIGWQWRGEQWWKAVTRPAKGMQEIVHTVWLFWSRNTADVTGDALLVGTSRGLSFMCMFHLCTHTERKSSSGLMKVLSNGCPQENRWRWGKQVFLQQQVTTFTTPACSPGSICDTCSLVFLGCDMPDTAAVSHLFSGRSHAFI